MLPYHDVTDPPPRPGFYLVDVPSFPEERWSTCHWSGDAWDDAIEPVSYWMDLPPQPYYEKDVACGESPEQLKTRADRLEYALWRVQQQCNRRNLGSDAKHLLEGDLDTIDRLCVEGGAGEHKECDKMHVKCSDCKEDIRGDFSKHTCPAPEYTPCARCNDMGFCAPWGDSDRDADDLTRCNECDFWTKRFKKDLSNTQQLDTGYDADAYAEELSVDIDRLCDACGGAATVDYAIKWAELKQEKLKSAEATISALRDEISTLKTCCDTEVASCDVCEPCLVCKDNKWVWRHELPDTSDWDGSADDTRYSCPQCEKDSSGLGVMPNPGEVQEDNRPPTPEPARNCRCGRGCKPQPEPCDWCLMYHKPGACEGITVDEPEQAKIDFSLVQEQLDALKELELALCEKCHGMGEIRTGQWAGGVRLDINDHGAVHEIVHKCDACAGSGKRVVHKEAVATPDDKADRMSEMWSQQKEFMDLLVEKRGFPAYPLDLTKKESQVFCKGIAYDAMGELFEAIQELRDSKRHRVTEIKELDRDKLLEEVIDAQHFLIELSMLMGFSCDEFFEAYTKKGLKNTARILEGY